MTIVVPAGFVLTSDNRIVPGGPICIALGAGMRMDSSGRIWSEAPRWDLPCLSAPLDAPSFPEPGGHTWLRKNPSR